MVRVGASRLLCAPGSNRHAPRACIQLHDFEVAPRTGTAQPGSREELHEGNCYCDRREISRLVGCSGEPKCLGRQTQMDGKQRNKEKDIGRLMTTRRSCPSSPSQSCETFLTVTGVLASLRNLSVEILLEREVAWKAWSTCEEQKDETTCGM
eukprot:799046-Amphidinium_carterae.2